MLFCFHHVLSLPHDDVIRPHDVDTLSKHSRLKLVQTKLVEESARGSQSSNVGLNFAYGVLTQKNYAGSEA